MTRQTEGNETWKTLQNWIRGDAAAERLSGLILLSDGFKSVNPSHPLGGKDGIKDLVSEKDGINWVAGVCFPRGQQSFGSIKKKFLSDAKGVVSNKANGFVFLTNQELRLSERDKLSGEIEYEVEIYHLERISLLLNSAPLYGVRLEFLDIEMTKEEQLAFMASRDKTIEEMQSGLARIERQMSKKTKPQVVNPDFEPLIGHLFVGKELKKCSHCGYGYYVSTAHHLLGMSSLLSGEATVACPSCGNVEKQ
jgi:hypothetical protein